MTRTPDEELPEPDFTHQGEVWAAARARRASLGEAVVSGPVPFGYMRVEETGAIVPRAHAGQLVRDAFEEDECARAWRAR